MEKEIFVCIAVIKGLKSALGILQSSSINKFVLYIVCLDHVRFIIYLKPSQFNAEL